MFRNAPMGMAKQTYTYYLCTGMIIVEKETHSDSHQDTDAPMASTPNVVVLFYKEEKKRGSEGYFESDTTADSETGTSHDTAKMKRYFRPLLKQC